MNFLAMNPVRRRDGYARFRTAYQRPDLSPIDVLVSSTEQSPMEIVLSDNGVTEVWLKSKGRSLSVSDLEGRGLSLDDGRVIKVLHDESYLGAMGPFAEALKELCD